MTKAITKENFVIPMTKTITKENRSNKIVSIDLGERTFACCLSENEIIKICNNGQEKNKNFTQQIRWYYKQ